MYIYTLHAFKTLLIHTNYYTITEESNYNLAIIIIITFANFFFRKVRIIFLSHAPFHTHSLSLSNYLYYNYYIGFSTITFD